MKEFTLHTANPGSILKKKKLAKEKSTGESTGEKKI